METEEYIRQELEKFVPPSEILKRAGGRGVEYSYVDRFYVISTLNRIFGAGAWHTTMTTEVAVDRVVVTCVLAAEAGGNAAHGHTDVGECLLLDNKGRPNENAATEAASQAFKRAASQLGNAFGLHLYREGKPPTPMAQPTSPPAQVAQAGLSGQVVDGVTYSVKPPDVPIAELAAQFVAGTGALPTTPQVVAGTLTKPDYQGAIQDAMANAEASAPAPVQQQAAPQVDLGRLEAARADVTVWKTRGKERGVPMRDLEEETLLWYAETYGKNLDEKPNPRYEQSNRAHLANIKLCLQFFHVQDAQAPQGNAEPQREGESWPTDDDIPF